MQRPGSLVGVGPLRRGYPRPVRRLLVLLVAVAALGAACGGSEPPPPSELTGVIVAVEGEGSDVTAFTLEAGLEEYEIRIAPEVDYGFALAHLREHQREALPVRCDLEERGGELYALTIEDVEQ